MRGGETALARLVQRNSFLIVCDRASVVAQSFQSKPECVQVLHVGRVNSESHLELLARSAPVVLHGKQLAQIVVYLRRLRTVANALLKFDLCRIKSANDHQIASQNLVRLRIPDVESKRFR